MNNKVEILKIGTVIPSIINKLEMLDGEKEKKDTIMMVCNGGYIFEYYVNILKNECGDDYRYLKTDQVIIGKPDIMSSEKTIKGIPDSEPLVGKSYSINNHWHTSTVMRIVNENIIITKNSVYAIHDISKFREKKLNELGIN